tara:strand:+ start:1677 stop:1838 length:162 start_codon:yes stop_codon:yes gene_type:complete
MTEDWETATNKVIANNLVSNLEKLLKGKATYYECSDKHSQHKKIVIEYDYSNK